MLVDRDCFGIGGVGYITQMHFHPQSHLVWLVDGSRAFAILRHQKDLTPIDPVFEKLLTDVNKESEND